MESGSYISYVSLFSNIKLLVYKTKSKVKFINPKCPLVIKCCTQWACSLSLIAHHLPHDTVPLIPRENVLKFCREYLLMFLVADFTNMGQGK